MQKIWIDAIEFESFGGWVMDTQFVREMGQSYLIANDIPGEPVENAKTKFSVEEDGYYRVFIRTKNWKMPYNPGQLKLVVDGVELPATIGLMPSQKWYWEIAGDIELKKGEHTLATKDLTGWLSRFAAVVITNDFDFIPSNDTERLLKQRAEIKNIDTSVKDMGDWDLIVVGAGPGGIPTALAAARSGIKVALISGREVIGGNASDEGTVGLDGAGAKNYGMHETGIANEIKRTKERFNLSWQGAVEKLVANEPNITTFLSELCIDCETENGIIKSIECVNNITLEKHKYSAPLFADCTGDGWLGYYAGAAYRIGREAKHEMNEEYAPLWADTYTMSGCLCGTIKKVGMRAFLAEDIGAPCEFELPEWATKLPEGSELHRTAKRVYTAEWWTENSNDYDDLFESEFSRDQLVCLGLGYFDWVKNSSNLKEEATNYKLSHIFLHNSKRENRRLVGDYVMNQNDFVPEKEFPDTISYCGWSLDLHHIKGMFSGKEGPFFSNTNIGIIPVPYRCLYSKNIKNLFMASRCSSFSHIALGSTRVESTLATLGQAAGTAAAFCKKYSCLPRDIYNEHIVELQQQLIKDDQTIFGIPNLDENDKARTATVSVTHSSEIEVVPTVTSTVELKTDYNNVINGIIRDLPGKSNAWYSDKGNPQSIILTLKEPSTISMVQVTTATDLAHPRYSFQAVPEFNLTAEDVTVSALVNGEWQEVGKIKGNYLRQMRFNFPEITVEAVKVTVEKSENCKAAKIFEVRVY